MKLLLALSLIASPAFADNCLDQGKKYKSKSSLRRSGQKSFGFSQKCQSKLQRQKANLERIGNQHRNTNGIPVSLASLNENTSDAWSRIAAMNVTNEGRDVEFPSLDWWEPLSEVHTRGMMKFGNRKSWSFSIGDKESIVSELKPFIGFFASRIEAAAEAGVELHGSFMGAWNGKLASLRTVAFSPGTGPLSADLQLFGPDGKQMWGKNVYKALQIKLEKNISRRVAMDTKWRFAIGPVPLASEIGAVGTVGIKNNLSLTPLQVSAWGKPFVSAEAFLMAGADIWFVGAGAGGQLKLASDEFAFDGRSLVEYNDEPTIRLESELSNNINLLSGELFAFVFLKIPLLRNRWMGKFTLFDWSGFNMNRTLYDSKYVLKRNRTLAYGDVDQSDRNLLRGWQLQKQANHNAISQEDISEQGELLSGLELNPEFLQKTLDFSRYLLQTLENE